MKKPIMIRTNIHLPEALLGKLKAISIQTGFPVSELVRTALYAYLKKEKL
jgi:metal-responsive CopG/Arc/MetJ family transcriptional regulator